MGKKGTVPDAWDDEWEEQADKSEVAAAEVPKVGQEVKVTKAERLAKHAETNKKIWESAEEPETFHFLAARDNVPLKSEFKPTLKVLSRKPAPKMVKRFNPVTGIEQLTVDDGEEEPEQQRSQLSPEELRLKTQKDREEKQKRYDEARARILGTPFRSSTPGTVTPPTEEKQTRGKGRGRGTGQLDTRRPESQTTNKELFDPNFTPRPGFSIHKQNGEGSRSGTSSPREGDQIIRSPRGPDGSGRGGFGFTQRGGRTS